MTAAGLTFLSWYRSGLSAGVDAPAGANAPLAATQWPYQAQIPIDVTLSNVPSSTFDVLLYSPGDVATFDPANIIRTEPPAGARGVETSFLPLVEFARPDLPWMLTPTAPQRTEVTDPDPRRGLLPWLVLVVIPGGSCTLSPPQTPGALPVLSAPLAELPDLSEAWLWAHVQVLTTGAAGETVEGVIAAQPDSALSRLISPRRLQPNTSYVACLVPTFDAGCAAGLGQIPNTAGQLGFAWASGGSDPVTLPVYYSWTFATGDGGDFEALARRLQPYDSGAAGVRPLDVGDAGDGLPQAAPGTWQISLEGVLVGAGITPGAWPASVPQATFAPALATAINGTRDELTPPVYGAMQANVTAAVAVPANVPSPWLPGLNLDPRYRVMSAIGTAVVQRFREALMASAWAQAGDLLASNARLARGQLAREASARIYQTRIGATSAGAPLADDRLMALTSAVQTRIPSSSAGGAASIAGAVAANVSAGAIAGVPFRRLARPGGPLARRTAATLPPSPLSSVAAGQLAVTPPLAPVSGQIAFAGISNGLLQSDITPRLVTTPVFPWEPSASNTPLTVPFGYMADLVVTGAPVLQSQSVGSAYIGSALDFTGVPQLGWSPLSGDTANAIYQAFPPMSGTNAATTCVDFNGRNGIITFTVWESTNYPDMHWYGWYNWLPGYLLDAELTPGGYGSLNAGGPIGFDLQALAVAATDLAGNGSIDVLFVFTTGETPQEQQGQPQEFNANTTYLIVGLGLDANGAMSGGYTAPQSIARGDGALSVTAMGAQMCVLFGPQLTVYTLNANGTLQGSAPATTFASSVPSDFVSGAIVSAAFGEGGMDVVFAYAAGLGGQLRAACAVAFDVQANGSIGSWSDTQGIPMPIGSSISIMLGVMSSAGAARRESATAAFRAAAAITQARQVRVLAAAGVPPAPPAIPLATLAQTVRTALDPHTTVTASVLTAAKLPANVAVAGVSDPLQAAVVAPTYATPMFGTFQEMFPDRVMPGRSSMPDNSVTLVVSNNAAIEAFLLGLNTEMSRALLWNGFPGNLQSTFFANFWDARDSSGTPEGAITAVGGWTPGSALGTHAPAGATTANIVLIVRGELLRRIPNVTVFAAPATAATAPRTVDLTKRLDPFFFGTFEPGTAYFGFELDAATARGDGGAAGWYFVFQEHPVAPRFGMNEPPTGNTSYGTPPATWRALSWNDVAGNAADSAALTYVDAASSPLAGVTKPDTAGGTPHRFGFSSAHMAHILFEPAVQIGIHGSLLLPPSGGGTA